MKCLNCGKNIPPVTAWPVQCSCGHLMKEPNNETGAKTEEIKNTRRRVRLGSPQSPKQLKGTPKQKRSIRKELPQYVTERRALCHACEFYLKEENGCGKLRPGRRNIDGALGIPNPKAKCPHGLWDSVESSS